MKGLYIHIPFCISKCNYCDFASFSGKQHIMQKYTEHLCNEMSLYKGNSFDTVYIGGGTPTVLPNKNIEQIFSSIFNNFTLAQNCEITVEANPKTLDISKARILKSFGVNRISLGAQSMVDDELKMLGRIHTSHDLKQTVEIVRNAGISNISIDIMYALPGQTLNSISTTISQVLKLNPNHISCYGLKIEEGTPFHTMLVTGQITEIDDDLAADMYESIVYTLVSNGFEHYELSNFAKPGFESRHNIKYWNCTDYIGIGLGAASCNDGVRYTNASTFDDYFNKFTKAESCVLTENDKMSEFIILGLRLIKQGVNKQEFYNRFKKDIYDVFGDVINRHIKNNLLSDDGKTIVLTARAHYISNYVMSDFVNKI